MYLFLHYLESIMIGNQLTNHIKQVLQGKNSQYADVCYISNLLRTEFKDDYNMYRGKKFKRLKAAVKEALETINITDSITAKCQTVNRQSAIVTEMTEDISSVSVNSIVTDPCPKQKVSIPDSTVAMDKSICDVTVTTNINSDSDLSLNPNYDGASNKTEISHVRVKRSRPSSNSDEQLSKPKRKRQKLSDSDSINQSFKAEHSVVSLDKVGGNYDIIKKISNRIRPWHHDTDSHHILLYGPSGCGKTLLVSAITGEFEYLMIRVSAATLNSAVAGETEARVQNLFSYAEEIAPCVLFIDDINKISPKKDDAFNSTDQRIVTQLCLHLQKLKESAKPVYVFGATNRIESMNSELRNEFNCQYVMGIPDESARFRILQKLISNMHDSLSPEVDLRKLAKNTPGFVGKDLENLLYLAKCRRKDRLTEESISKQKPHDNSIVGTGATENIDDDFVEPKRLRYISINEDLPEHILSEDFEYALKQITPFAQREGFPTKPEVSCDDVRGLDHILDDLRESIIWPAKFPNHCQKFNLVKSGILLHGPPGNGKTSLAKAISNECCLNFLCVNGPELFNKYLGESERSVRELFARAACNIPCVIFFDEVNAMCRKRQGTDGETNKTGVLDQLLTMLDGFEERKQVFVIGATNRLDLIDKALLRPGRFDKILFVGLPDEKARLEILKAHSRRCIFAEDVSLEEIATFSEHFSGADLAKVIVQAGTNAMREIIKSLKETLGEINDEDQLPPIMIYQRHLLAAVRDITPSVSADDLQFHLNQSRLLSTY